MALTINRGLALRAGMWSAVESGGLSMLSFASLVAFSRLLSPADFGVFAVALSTIEIVALLPNMMFHDALIQREDCNDRHEGTASLLSGAIAIVICAGCWTAAPYYSRLVNDPRAGAVLGVLSIGLLFAAPITPIITRQKRQFGFRLLAIRSLTGRLIGALVGLIAAIAGVGVWSLVIQWVAMQAIGSLMLIVTVDRRPRPCFDRQAAAELLRFGLPALAALFAGFAMRRVMTIAAGILLGAQATGMLNLASRLVDTFWSVASTAVSQVALSTLTALRRDAPRQRQAYLKAVHLAVTLFFPAFAGIAVVAPDLIRLLFGARWVEAAPLASGLALTVLLPAVRLFMPPYLTALGRPSSLFRVNAATLAIFVAAIALLKPNSTLNMVILLAATECLSIALYVRVLLKSSGISAIDHIRSIAGPAFSTVAMAAIIVPVYSWASQRLDAWLTLIVVGSVGAAVYLAIAVLVDPAVANAARQSLRSLTRRRQPEPDL